MSSRKALCTFLLVFMVVTVKARPAEPPTKFSLDTSLENTNQPTKWEQGMEFASETRNNVASVIEAKKDIWAQGSTAFNSIASSAPFENFFPPNTRETVRLESENAASLAERQKPNPIGRLLENYLKPIPLVDKIQENEKYGNSGDKFIGIGRALVGGLEGLSNFLNAVVDFPIDTAKKTSRGVTEALNQLGGRLVGLQ